MNVYIGDSWKKEFTKSWDDSKFPNAKQLRDTEARELRKKGYKVKTKTWNFIDLGRFKLYELTAYK